MFGRRGKSIRTQSSYYTRPTKGINEWTTVLTTAARRDSRR